MFPHLPFSETQTTLALTVFLFTFAYEDGATFLAATLAAAGRLDVRLGFASAFLGIWTGDVGLYLLGSNLGVRAEKSRWLTRFVSTAAIAKARVWFERRGALTIIVSRFVPGSRLPLYVAAGALRLPGRTFGAITGVCAALWVAAIFVAWRFSPVGHASARTRWLVVAAMLLGPWIFSKTAASVARVVRRWWKKYQHWEFWPPWLFYPPVAAMCGWLALKYRGVSLPAIANTSFRNGGVVGESKIEILQALMRAAPDTVAEGYLISTGDVAERYRALEQICAQHSISWPFVLKPNLGQRGAGFRLVRTSAEAKAYLAGVTSDVVLQRYVPDEKEIGIFYYRLPRQSRGEIFAITEKHFPVIIGDGKRTFEELLDADERASLIADVYHNRFPELHGRVLPSGERLRLVEAGNHCQGCIFRDGSRLMSEALRERIDQISKQVPGFFIGRYDIRYSSKADLKDGENFTIIELNGAASEATNIYDDRNSLVAAYRTLYRQWELVYAIGCGNRDLGHKPPSLMQVLKDVKHYYSISAAYPAAD